MQGNREPSGTFICKAWHGMHCGKGGFSNWPPIWLCHEQWCWKRKCQCVCAQVRDWKAIMPPDVHLYNAYKDRKRNANDDDVAMKVPQMFTFVKREGGKFHTATKHSQNDPCSYFYLFPDPCQICRRMPT